MSILDICSSAATCDRRFTTVAYISISLAVVWAILAIKVFRPTMEASLTPPHHKKLRPHRFAPMFLSLWVVGVPVWFLYEYGYMHPEIYKVVVEVDGKVVPIKDQAEFEKKQWACYKEPNILHEDFKCEINEGEVERVDHAQELASKIWLAVILCLGVLLGIKWPPTDG